MKREDAEEFTQSLGQIVGGSWRQIALAERLGVAKALGYDSLETWVRERIGGYMKLPAEERREALKELEHLSAEKAGEVFGVNEKTIDRDRKAIAGTNAPDGEPDTEEETDDLGTFVPSGQESFWSEEDKRLEREKVQRSNLFSGLGKIASLASIIATPTVATHHAETLLSHWDEFHVQERRTPDEMHAACKSLLAARRERGPHTNPADQKAG